MIARAYSVSGPLADVAAVWAAACDVAGAYAPKHIAAALSDYPERGLVSAVCAGLASALAESQDSQILPRGCEVAFGCLGEIEIVWRTSVETTLTAPERRAGQWWATCWLSNHATRLDAARAASEVRGLDLVASM